MPVYCIVNRDKDIIGAYVYEGYAVSFLEGVRDLSQYLVKVFDGEDERDSFGAEKFLENYRNSDIPF